MPIWVRDNGDGLIGDLRHDDPAGHFHPDVVWVQVPEALAPWLDYRTWTVGDGTVGPPDLTTLLEQMADAVAARRWTEQVAGVVYDGHRYHTDTEGRQSITGAVVGAQIHETENGPGTFEVEWKTMDGFVDLGLSGLSAAGQAVLTYLSACYRREARIRTALEEAVTDPDATPDSVVQVFNTEIDTGWPAQQDA